MLKALIPLFLAALMLASPYSLSKASAQTASTVPPAPVLQHQMIFWYTDGTSFTISDQATGVPQYTYSLTQGQKTIDHVENRMILSLIQQGATLSFSAASETMQVIGRDGIYHNVPLTVTVNDYNVQNQGNGNYLIHDSTVTAAAIENVIGIGSTPFNAVIRVATAPAGAAAGVLYNGQTTVYAIAQTHPSYTATACTSTTLCGGGGGGGGGGGSGPSGTIYQYVQEYDTSGRVAAGCVIAPQQTYSVVVGVQNCASGLLTNITHIDWNLYLQIDSNTFLFPPNYNAGFANPGATNNYGVTVAGQGVANTANTQIIQLNAQNSAGAYHLMDIDVKMSDVQNLLQNVGPPAGGVQISSAPITYTVNPATLTLSTSSGVTYPVSVQGFTWTTTLIGQTLVGTPPCDINNLSCSTAGSLDWLLKPIATLFNTTTTNAAFILAGGGVVGVGAVAALAKHKTKK